VSALRYAKGKRHKEGKKLTKPPFGKVSEDKQWDEELYEDADEDYVPDEDNIEEVDEDEFDEDFANEFSDEESIQVNTLEDGHVEMNVVSEEYAVMRTNNEQRRTITLTRK
jgi:hypothetical protein